MNDSTGQADVAGHCPGPQAMNTFCRRPRRPPQRAAGCCCRRAENAMAQRRQDKSRNRRSGKARTAPPERPSITSPTDQQDRQAFRNRTIEPQENDKRDQQVVESGPAGGDGGICRLQNNQQQADQEMEAVTHCSLTKWASGGSRDHQDVFKLFKIHERRDDDILKDAGIGRIDLRDLPDPLPLGKDTVQARRK